MSRIRIRYDHIGQRWSVERVGDEARYDLLPEGGRDDLHIARDPQGAIVELMADAAVPDDTTLGLVAAAFGTAARAVLLARPDRDLDTVLDIVDPTDRADATGTDIAPATPAGPDITITSAGVVGAGRPTLAGRPAPIVIATAADRPPALPGEPGVPAALPTQPHVYRVPPDPNEGGITAPAVLEHHLGEAEVVVRVPGHLAGGPFWVRVADGTTGIVLALGRLAAGTDPAGAAEMRVTLTFALDVPLDALHVAVSAEPLTVPTDRDTRRRRWADALEREADAAAATDPTAASATWHRAAEVRDALGDHDTAAADRARARATTGRSSARQRRRWVGLGVLAAVVVTVLAIALWLLTSLGARGDDELTPPLSAAYRATNAGPERFEFGQPGASDEMTVLLTLTGDATIRAGDTITMTLQTELRSRFGYSTRVDCVSAAAGQSGELGNGEVMNQPSFTPVLEVVAADGTVLERRALAPITVDRRVALAFPELEGCDVFPSSGPGAVSMVEGLARLVPVTVEVSLPVDLSPGSYVVGLDRAGEAGLVEGESIVFQVLPAN